MEQNTIHSGPIRLRLELHDNYNGLYSRTYEWQAGVLCFSYQRALFPEVRVTPTDEDWQRFWSVCEACDVWKWKRSYIVRDVMDGSGWLLDLSDGVRSITTEGLNKEPKQFKRFVEGVRILAGEPAEEKD